MFRVGDVVGVLRVLVCRVGLIVTFLRGLWRGWWWRGWGWVVG